MRKLAYLGLTLILATGIGLAAPKDAAKAKTFVGNISDSMCGAKHMMAGTARECTLECVDAGSKFVLVDAEGTVYGLSDQSKPRQFAGEKVKVTGTLKGNTIEVAGIEAAK
jgi:hypothetical protein